MLSRFGLGLGGVTRVEGARYPFVNTEAAALVARFTVPATDERKGLIDALIGSLKSAGVWARLDGFWMLAAHAAQPARQNWLKDEHNLTAISSPAFTVDRGYRGDGSASYLQIGETGSFTKFLLDNAEFGVWSRVPPTNGQALMGAGNRTRLWPILSDPTCVARINSSATASYGQPDTVGLGLFSAATDNPTTQTILKNGVQVGSGNRSLQSIEQPSRFVGSIAATFSDGQAAMGYSGGALTSQQRAALYSATLNYLQAVGAV